MIAPDAPFVHPLGDAYPHPSLEYREALAIAQREQRAYVARLEQAVREGKRATLCVGKLPHERGAA